VWEAVVALLGLLLVALLLVGGGYAVGLFFLATTSVWIASRIRVAEPGHIAGAFAIRRGRLHVARTGILFAIYLGVCLALLVAAQDHWSRDIEGQVAAYSLAALGFLLLREIRQSGDTAFNWLTGGRAEQAVAGVLEPLKSEGWIVIDNFVRDDGWGNVDHVVWG
jgi:hypothetical protein